MQGRRLECCGSTLRLQPALEQLCGAGQQADGHQQQERGLPGKPADQQAAERGAERALACLGLENGHAARDIRDLRGLIDAWREARRTAWQTTVKVLTTGVLAALLVGIAIKLRLMGGPQ